MAEKGTYTAYQQLRPLQGDVSQDIQQQEENGARRRSQAGIEAERLLKHKEEKRKTEEDFIKKSAERSKALGLWDMKSMSGNDVIRGGLALASEEMGRLGMIRDSEKSTLAEKVQAEGQIEALMKFPENAKIVTDFLMNENALYNENTTPDKNGKVKWHKNAEYEKKFQDDFAGIKMVLDKNMGPAVLYLDKEGNPIDKNGDGTISDLDYDSLETMKNRGRMPAAIPYYDEEELVKGVLDRLEPNVGTTSDGKRATTTTAVTAESLSAINKSLFYDGEGNPSPVLKSLAITKNIDLTDKKGLEGIVKNINQRFIAGEKKGIEEKDLYNNLDAQKEANAQKERTKKDKVSWGVVTTPPANKEAGFNSMYGYKSVAVQGKVIMPAITLKVGGKNETITNGQIQSYTVVKNGKGQRSIVAEVAYEDEKNTRTKEGDPNAQTSFLSDGSGTTVTTGERKKTKIIPLTEAQADVFSRQLGFKNVNEMKDSARSGDKEENKSNNDPLGLGL